MKLVLKFKLVLKMLLMHSSALDSIWGVVQWTNLSKRSANALTHLCIGTHNVRRQPCMYPYFVREKQRVAAPTRPLSGLVTMRQCESVSVQKRRRGEPHVNRLVGQVGSIGEVAIRAVGKGKKVAGPGIVAL